jgi:RNA polymerase sigma factor (sigma-70 family)
LALDTKAPSKDSTPVASRPANTVNETILQRIAAGDQAAVAECMDKYGGLIWSLARQFLRSAEDAEDVVQDIFIELWSKADSFDPDKAGETTFVAMIARRRIIDRLRKLGRQPQMEELDEAGLLDQGSDSNHSETVTDLAKAEKVIAVLKPESQKVLYLSIYQGHSHNEISELLNVPLGTVKTTIRRGLIKIREYLEED